MEMYTYLQTNYYECTEKYQSFKAVWFTFMSSRGPHSICFFISVERTQTEGLFRLFSLFLSVCVEDGAGNLNRAAGACRVPAKLRLWPCCTASPSPHQPDLSGPADQSLSDHEALGCALPGIDLGGAPKWWVHLCLYKWSKITVYLIMAVEAVENVWDRLQRWV